VKFNQDNRSVFRFGQRLAVMLLVAGWAPLAFGQEPIVEKRSDGTTVV